MAADNRSSKKRLKVAIVGPSLNYVGGQSVQADLLLRLWQDDPDVEMSFIAVDPPLLPGFAWAERVRGLRTILREPLYFLDLWHGLRDVDVG